MTEYPAPTPFAGPVPLNRPSGGVHTHGSLRGFAMDGIRDTLHWT